MEATGLPVGDIVGYAAASGLVYLAQPLESVVYPSQSSSDSIPISLVKSESTVPINGSNVSLDVARESCLLFWPRLHKHLGTFGPVVESVSTILLAARESH